MMFFKLWRNYTGFVKKIRPVYLVWREKSSCCIFRNWDTYSSFNFDCLSKNYKRHSALVLLKTWLASVFYFSLLVTQSICPVFCITLEGPGLSIRNYTEWMIVISVCFTHEDCFLKVTVQAARMASVTVVSVHTWKKYKCCKKGGHMWSQHNFQIPVSRPVYANKQPAFPSVGVSLHEHICSLWLLAFCLPLLVRERANMSLFLSLLWTCKAKTERHRTKGGGKRRQKGKDKWGEVWNWEDK